MRSAVRVAGLGDADGAEENRTQVASMTVRELIAALARTEEELRGLRDPVRVGAPDEDPVRRRIETVAAQGRIVRELRFRRRSPFVEAPHTRTTRVVPPPVE